ncbi:MAG: Gfo/Idh/MocA family oxidoreductase [Candidatus Bathyarchaeota archaeon]|nr:Gfo/Idh/MocA family oxidoreductase [Candidatus Bathyarchaeota archaeon]
MKTINVSVIGCGVWGSNHARVYNEIPSINLKSVADIDKKSVEKVAEKFNIEGYTDFEKIINDKNVEAVSICTPTVTHANLALLAIKAGKHVLVEKPMTNTITEAKQLIKAADKHDVKLAVGFVERFNPAVQEAFKLIKEGQIGKIILARTSRVSRRPARIGDVGVVKDLGIHDIDIISQLFQINPETIYASCGSIDHSYEDYANINLRYTENRNAFIETNWLTPRIRRNLIITGTNGIITVQYRTQQITIENNRQLIQPYIQYQEPLKLELESFINSIRDNKDPVVTGEDGLKALTIAEAALESCKTMEIIDFHKFQKDD